MEDQFKVQTGQEIYENQFKTLKFFSVDFDAGDVVWIVPVAVGFLLLIRYIGKRFLRWRATKKE